MESKHSKIRSFVCRIKTEFFSYVLTITGGANVPKVTSTKTLGVH